MSSRCATEVKANLCFSFPPWPGITHEIANRYSACTITGYEPSTETKDHPMDSWLVFWILGSLVSCWLALADVIGSLRFKHTRLTYRGLLYFLWAIVCSFRIYDQDVISVVFMFFAMIWSIWYWSNKTFENELHRKGIRRIDLLLFRKNQGSDVRE